ncbi:MAG TPA: helicase-associated domain-containing protein [Anaerolineae bacterium]|nr:helicase-associated domain-containing protein [Anaerolineae bacterium]
MSDDLKSLLDRYSSGAVTAIASHHSVLPKGPKVKAEIIDTLARVLPHRHTVEKSLNDLSKTERVVVDVILQRGGQASVHALRQELLRQKLIDQSYEITFDRYSRTRPDPRRTNSRRLEDIVARLTLRGLVFSAEDPFDPRRDVPGYTPAKCDFDQALKTAFIPEPIRRHLPQPPPLPEAPPPKPIEVAAVEEGSARTFQRDLYLYWSYVRDHKVTVTAKGDLHKKALGEVDAVLLTRAPVAKGDAELNHPRLRFLRGLLTALGLLSMSPERELLAAPDADFFAQPPADRVRRGYEAWRDGDFYNDLLSLPSRLRPSSSQLPLIPAHPSIVEARRRVLDLIGKSDVKGWRALDRLCEQMQELDDEFLFRRPPRRSSYYYGYSGHPYSGLNPLGVVFPEVHKEEEGWEKVEANFIRGIVTGPLFWMGLTDLGSSGKPVALSAFRLTPLGAWALGLGPRPEIPAEGGRVIVQPNLHVVALDPVNEALLAALDRFAERLNAERAVEYRLTRASVYAGQQAGWDVARIKSFLREQTGAEIPANVARTLDEWQAQHERILIRPHAALAHGSPAALDTLLDDPDAADQVAARLLPDVAILRRASAVKRLTQALHARAILPLVSTRPAVPPGSVVASESGEVRFAVRAPSLYLHGHLAAFADPGEEGRYGITAETIGRATRSGLTAHDILDRLAAIQRGSLPDALARRIRAWAKHYGDAALEEIALLQVRDAQTLEELLADPELGPLLKRFAPNRHQALARIQTTDMEQLRRLLAERGIDLSDKLK